ncbi:1-acylglycerol-3-phosphate O-acyltransferase [Aestuariibacter sp. AA17]|uniref:1-acyl-sn-glycerol-3-phosphate acyltransferase n=1 Tax=Fluctibacter corallii TaxID=2984329 RepID=A0ABT3A710_9ALTE|nr:1-acylglycerol-3-phosphate O-acyltransferase [Aestuariibacter sp. AA17]MCV2884434.1 1-acylglycerol-3-phosphate O-acyltransferase [Aestuariibacter sp. AA17]
MLAILRIVILFFYFIGINIALIAMCLVRPFHRNNVYAAAMVYGSMSRIMGLKVKLEVPESVKKGGPYVLICNHQNSFDLVTVCLASQKGMVTVGKKSLKWIPIFGWLYWLTGNILIDRQNKGKAHDTLKATVEKIKQRRLSVWFFPEGTRSYGRGLLPFKTGAFRIAQATNEPVVTVCASNLHNKVNLNRWDNGTLLIKVCEPESMDDSKDIKGWAEYFRDKMKKEIQVLDARVEELENPR